MRRKRILKKLVPEYEAPMGEINITPLVDVSFTILIIFILIAPILEQGITLKLPQAKAKKFESQESLTIEIDKKGWIFLDGERVSQENLANMLSTLAEVRKEMSVLIRADQDNAYGTIIDILDTIKNAGFEHVGLVTRDKP